MILKTNGCIRWVVLTRRLAFKFPAPRSVRNFLYGMLNNMNESENSTKTGACPVLCGLPFGLLNVMPRAREMSEEEFECLDVESFCYRHVLVVENKSDSFGFLNGRVVAVDYGFPRDLHW